MDIIQSNTLTYFGGIDSDLPDIIFNNDDFELLDTSEKKSHKKKMGAAESAEFIKKHWSMFDDLGFKLDKIIEVDVSGQVSNQESDAALVSAKITAAHEDSEDPDDESDDDIANYLGGQEEYFEDIENSEDDPEDYEGGLEDSEGFIDDFVKTQTSISGSYNKHKIDEYDSHDSHESFDFYEGSKDSKDSGDSKDSEEDYFDFYE